jgi:hypothetical protein
MRLAAIKRQAPGHLEERGRAPALIWRSRGEQRPNQPLEQTSGGQEHGAAAAEQLPQSDPNSARERLVGVHRALGSGFSRPAAPHPQAHKSSSCPPGPRTTAHGQGWGPGPPPPGRDTRGGGGSSGGMSKATASQGRRSGEHRAAAWHLGAGHPGECSSVRRCLLIAAA